MNRERDAISWWQGLRDDEPVAQQCQACHAWRWPARALCNRCGSFDFAWTPLSRRATVASWIVNHHAFSRAFAVPYTIVMGRLEEQSDVIVPGLFRGDSARLSIGLALHAEIEPASDPDPSDPESNSTPVLTWIPANPSASS